MWSARGFWGFALLALAAAMLITRGLTGAPGYTDAFYHFNAAVRLASGQGLTDAYLWTYIGAPDALPPSGVFPSHLYWMPLTSITAALGMAIFNAPGSYAAAQVPLALMYAAAALVGFALGRRLGGTARHAWIAGLLTIFSGFFVRYWGATDTFAPYALIGSLALLALAYGVERGGWRGFAAGGALTALAHLTRADGLLLLIVGALVIIWPTPRRSLRARVLALIALLVAYVIVMLPWFARNLSAVGTPLPLGGTAAIWFTQYNDLFNYPPYVSPTALLVDGAAALLASRWEALTNNLATFVAVEGLIAMTPLMLIGLWIRRRSPFLRPFWLYALGLHLAMTFVFPFPGYRGGLFHSAAALVPWWAALGVVGLDDAVDWLAQRRRWRAPVAKIVFSAALVILAVSLSAFTGLGGRVPAELSVPPLYAEVDALLTEGARVMINDPAQFAYYTGRGGVVLPNSDPAALPEIAARYAVDYLLLEADGAGYALPARLAPVVDAPPEFLSPVPLEHPDARLYVIRR
jgi:4-amino-4-deoxy-L-arabinose transferase-like glycosyltransferase